MFSSARMSFTMLNATWRLSLMIPRRSSMASIEAASLGERVSYGTSHRKSAKLLN